MWCRREFDPLAAVLDALDDAQALLVVAVEQRAARIAVGVGARLASVARQAARERLLPRMAERRVPEIVPERDRLGEVLDGARDLRDLERVGQAGAVVVAFRGEEDLGLVREAPERFGVEDLVAVALEIVAQDVRGGRAVASLAVGGERRLERQQRPLALLLVLAVDDSHGRLLSSGFAVASV